MQNVCIVPHPTEDRPCLTRFAHDLEACPQCGGTGFVEEQALEQLMEQAQGEEVPKRSRRATPSSKSTE